MIKKCPSCGHIGELTWRDGKYHCAMCDHEVAETEPVVRPATVVNNAICPICQNRENNEFDGTRYRCSLCRTPFDLPKEPVQPANTTVKYADAGAGFIQNVKDGFRQNDTNLIWGTIFLFLFWPVGVYFLYKFHQSTKN